jgi:hypothetical protein
MNKRNILDRTEVKGMQKENVLPEVTVQYGKKGRKREHAVIRQTHPSALYISKCVLALFD